MNQKMETTKQRLGVLQELAKEFFPDGNDLKGFAGISKDLILNIFDQSSALLVSLTEYDNEFETILLKRELADTFDKIHGYFSASYDKLKPNEFDNLLRKISKIKFLSKDTFLSITERKPIRTETDISKAKEDLALLAHSIEELKKVSAVLSELSAQTTKNLKAADMEIASLKTVTATSINGFLTEVTASKDKALVDIKADGTEINRIKTASDAILHDLEAKQKKALESEVKADAILVKIEAHKTAIEAINNNVTAWEAQIKKANEEISASSASYASLVKKISQTQTSIDEAYKKICGSQDANGILVKGYLQETEDLKTNLDKFYTASEVKYKAQFDHIETLLPGATTAGLAEAFEKQKKSYTRQIQLWSAVFIGTTILMTVFGINLIFPGLFNSKTIPILETKDLGQGLMLLLKDLPFFIPTIWLAVFASKQQSQFKRLQQEYAFKETNAKSFYGYKKQIEELGKEGAVEKDLLNRLIGQLVVITAQNPSSTLDNKSHDDGPFFMKLLDRMFPAKKKENVVETVTEHLLPKL